MIIDNGLRDNPDVWTSEMDAAKVELCHLIAHELGHIALHNASEQDASIFADELMKLRTKHKVM